MNADATTTTELSRHSFAVEAVLHRGTPKVADAAGKNDPKKHPNIIGIE
jgi:hypothetical protein